MYLIATLCLWTHHNNDACSSSSSLLKTTFICVDDAFRRKYRWWSRLPCRGRRNAFGMTNILPLTSVLNSICLNRHLEILLTLPIVLFHFSYEFTMSQVTRWISLNIGTAKNSRMSQLTCWISINIDTGIHY
jgi:hypothetical protein